jgi:flagellar basal-body rod protein FlgG
LPRRASATVHAGYLEESTVNPLVEMTDLVAAQRAYEADQKAAQRADETLRRAVTDVPAVRS